MDTRNIWVYICSILIVVSASENRQKRDLTLLKHIMSGVSGANTGKCRYKSIVPEVRSFNINIDQAPQEYFKDVNLPDSYKIMPYQNYVEHMDLNDKQTINDNAMIGKFDHRKLCPCEENEKSDNYYNNYIFGTAQNLNRKKHFYHRNYLARTNLQNRYINFGKSPIPFYYMPLQKITDVTVKRPVNMIPFQSFNRYHNQQDITGDNTVQANVKNRQQKYSYEQILGDLSNIYSVDKNGDVVVTQTKNSLSTNRGNNKDYLSELSHPSNPPLNSVVFSKNNLNSAHTDGHGFKQNYIYKQTRPGLIETHTVDRNGDVTVTETKIPSPQFTQYMTNKLQKLSSISNANNAESPWTSNDAKSPSSSNNAESASSSNNAESTSSSNSEQTAKSESEYNENVIYTYPITSKYTYKQINHMLPNKFTVVNVESPQPPTTDMLDNHINENIISHGVQEKSDSLNKSFVNLSENPVIVQESPSYKYVQSVGDTSTVIKANEDNVVSVTIDTSRNNDYRGDVPEY